MNSELLNFNLKTVFNFKNEKKVLLEIYETLRFLMYEF
jgi:hypothetical protein